MDPGADEGISLVLWFLATVVGGVAMVVLGSQPLDIVIASFAVVVGGWAYATLHYQVWGVHVLSIGRTLSLRRRISAYSALLFPVILPISLLILTTPAIEAVEDGVTFSIAVVLAAVTALSVIVIRVRWG
jgi:hypothetical protein